MLLPMLTAVLLMRSETKLDDLCSATAAAACTNFGLQPNQVGIAISVAGRSGGYRADQAMYPASVVKLFYLAYLSHQLETKRLKMTPELNRAATDMIVESVNDATGLVLETLTGTTGGPELSPRALKAWMDRRQAVNRWFATLGYKGVNACQKTWNEGPYGRERQGYGPKFEHRNSLTPEACLRLMDEVMTDKIATVPQCAWMRTLLHRTAPANGPTNDAQATDFVGKVVPKGWELWSKAGWTSEVQHDVAHLRTPDGRELTMVIFTKPAKPQADVIPFIAEKLIQASKDLFALS